MPQAKSSGDLRKASAIEEIENILPRGTETVLLVEDEESVRGVTRDSLLRRGYKILEARNGEEAMEISRAYAEPIHLLITDMVMPGVPTRFFTQTISQQRPGIPILYMSGFTDALVRSGIDESAAFLQKPFTQATLAKRVRERIDRKPSQLRVVFDSEKDKKRKA